MSFKLLGGDSLPEGRMTRQFLVDDEGFCGYPDEMITQMEQMKEVIAELQQKLWYTDQLVTMYQREAVNYLKLYEPRVGLHVDISV